LAILKLAQFQFSLNKSEKSDLPLGQLAPVSPTSITVNMISLVKRMAGQDTLGFHSCINEKHYMNKNKSITVPR
jgi:hypothetical protein